MTTIMPSNKTRETTDRRNNKKTKVPKYFSSRTVCASMFPRLASGGSDSIGLEEDCPSSPTASHDEEDELITVYTLRPNDVLFGRGSGPNGFSGNVRYRNLIRSILIRACKMDHVDPYTNHGDDLPDFFLPDTDQEISVARRNRILAKQVVKAIKSRKGRFLQRVSSPSSLPSKGRNSSISVSNHIERVVYKEVEESVAFEKTKQNFRDQMRLLEMEHDEGIHISTRDNEEPPKDSWVLSSRNSRTSCLTGGKRGRDNDYSLSSESVNMRQDKMTRILSSQEMEMQHGYALASPACHPLPTTTLNSYNLLAAPRSVPCDSFYQNDDILFARPQYVVPLSQIGDPRDHGFSYMHVPATTQPLFIQEARPIVVYNNTRPQFLEDHLRMKSSIMMHGPQAFLVKEDIHPPSSKVLLSLGGGPNDIFSSHRLVASSPRPRTTLPMPIMSRGNYDGPVALMVATPPTGSRTNGQVEAMIASYQTRQDQFRTGWAANGSTINPLPYVSRARHDQPPQDHHRSVIRNMI